MAHAQTDIRSSLAGEASANSLKRGMRDTDYNLKLGPVLFQFTAGMGFEFNDNITLAEHGRQSDLILRPDIGINAVWPMSELNTLNLKMGVGYAKYLEHPENDSTNLLIDPDSLLNFDLFIGDFKIDFHDQFSLQQDPLDQVTLNHVTQFTRFSNTAGVMVDWDLNDLVLSAGYDRGEWIALDSQFGYLDHSDDIFSTKALFKLNPTTDTGVAASLDYTDYVHNYSNSGNSLFKNDGAIYTVGPFLDMQWSEYLSMHLGAGLSGGFFDKTGSLAEANTIPPPGVLNKPVPGAGGDNNSFLSYYFNIGFDNRLNSYLTQNLSFTRTTTPGLNSNYLSAMTLRHTVSWNVMRNTSLGTNLMVERADESDRELGGSPGDSIWRYGGGISAAYQITRKLTASLSYQYTQNDSSLLFRDYDQNKVLLQFNYQF